MKHYRLSYESCHQSELDFAVSSVEVHVAEQAYEHDLKKHCSTFQRSYTQEGHRHPTPRLVELKSLMWFAQYSVDLGK